MILRPNLTRIRNRLFLPRYSAKVFGVGFNKTGTHSLDYLFKSFGLVSYHGMYSDWVIPDDPQFGRFQAFSDGERHEFRMLDIHFPRSKFILTIRNLKEWLVSRVRHVHYRRSTGQTGWMRQEYERDSSTAIRAWINRRYQYHRDIRAYFSNRPNDFLILNICDSKNALEDVATMEMFLGKSYGGKRDEMPEFNVRLGDAQEIREAAEDQVIAELRALGIPESKWHESL